MSKLFFLLNLNLIIINFAFAEPQLPFDPESTVPIKFETKEYSKIDITGRCTDPDGTEQNGPKNTQPLLIANSPKLHNLEIRTSKFKTLEEHAAYIDDSQNDKTEFRFSINQSGCDHPEVKIEILVKEIFTNTCKARMLEKLQNYLNRIPFNSDLKGTNLSLQQILNIKEWMRDTPSIKCQSKITSMIGEKGMCMDKGNITCNKNDDPNYLSIESHELKNDINYVVYTLAYYQVL